MSEQESRLGELYQSIQYLDQLITQLQTNLETISREILIIKQSKDSINAIAKNTENILIPIDAKSYSLVKAEKVDNAKVLVRVSSKHYAPLPPSEAIIVLDEEEKRLLKASDEVKRRISELVSERNRLQSNLSGMLQQAQNTPAQSEPEKSQK
ncbi:MAG: prefoldin subunit alpha [Desulfurococcales archaeon]|nr:prefoldin subunit alpha [Desulfurococcales archaeon]